MYIKRYTIASFILIALVGWYVFAFVTQESMSIDIFGVHSPSLSIATWIVIPIVVLYVSSVAHMLFYNFLASMKLKRYEKDYEKIIGAIVEAYLGKKVRNHSYKTERYQLLGSLVDNSVLFPKYEMIRTTSNVKINNVIKIIENIKAGEVVELKEFSLSPNNLMVIQNERNRYKKGDLSAEDILSHESKYDISLCEEVFVDFVKVAPLYAIEKYKSFLSKESLFVTLSRVNDDENRLEISNEILMSLFKEIDLNLKDYIKISSILSLGMVPEQRMKLFESISENNEDAMGAYIYTLFDLELLELVDEILDISLPDEYMNFKAYRALKECNKQFSINLFV